MSSLERLRAQAAAMEAERKREKESADAAQSLRWKQEQLQYERWKKQRVEWEEASKLLDESSFERFAGQFQSLSESVSGIEVVVEKDNASKLFLGPKRNMFGEVQNYKELGYEHDFLSNDSRPFIAVAWKKPYLKLLDKPVGFVIECDKDGRIFIQGSDRLRLSYDDWHDNVPMQEEAFDFAINHPKPLLRATYSIDHGSSGYMEGPGGDY